MHKQDKFKTFLRYEGKILLLTIVLILIAAGITWRTFFRNSTDNVIRRDYLIEDISTNSAISPERLNQYSDDELEFIGRLDLNGLMAMEKYPEATRRLYGDLKNFALFYEVVEEFGPHHIIPVLDYFYEEGHWNLMIENEITGFLQDVIRMFKKPDSVSLAAQAFQDSLSERQQRLLMILNEIDTQKHNFLARFEFTTDGAKRNHVSTVVTSVSNFFTGGLSRFNAAVVTRGITEVTTEELVDAGIDILVLVPFVAYFSRSAKVGGGAIRAGRAGALAEKTAVREGVGAAVRTRRWARMAEISKGVWRAIPIRTLFRLKNVKWYILGLAVIKPDLINHAASLVAKSISVPPVVMKTGFWFLIFFPVLNLLFPAYYLLRSAWRRIHSTKHAVVAA